VTSGENVLVMSRQWAHTQGCAMAQAVKSRSPLGLRLFPGQSIWEMWCIKWQWGRFFFQVLRFSAVGIIPPVQHTHFIHLPLMLYFNNLD
jgi:hypothetical protein